MSITLQWPVTQHNINQNFMENKYFDYTQFGHPGHEGIDFPVLTGTPVMASADGVVLLTYSPYDRAYGTHVWIRHDMPDGTVYRTLYAHLSQINVSNNQRVTAGTVVGLSGNTGNSTGPHLHFSLKKDGASVAGETVYRVVVNNLQKKPNTNLFWNVGDMGTFKYDYIDPTPFFVPPVSYIPVQNVPPVVRPKPQPVVQPTQPAASTTFSTATPSTTPTYSVPQVEPEDTVLLPDHPLRGIHGEGGADWMLKNGVRGWAVEPIYSNGILGTPLMLDYTAYANAGIRVVLRWDYSKSKEEGGTGSFPPRAKLNEFANWCIQSISATKGAWGHIIGREPNRSDASPDGALSAADVVSLYNAIWFPLPKGVRLSPPAVDPASVDVGDPRNYALSVYKAIKGAEFFALHAYSYGSAQAADANIYQKNLTWQYQSFRMWEPFAEVIYRNLPNYRHIPLVISEANHFRYGDAALGWDDSSAQWLQNVMRYVYDWNHGDGDQYAHAVCIHRFPGDLRGLQNRAAILQVLISNGDKAI
jgi:hypothetical protein